jgi:hypothetical protein
MLDRSDRNLNSPLARYQPARLFDLRRSSWTALISLWIATSWSDEADRAQPSSVSPLLASSRKTAGLSSG